MNQKAWLDVAFKVLSVLIIPILLWGFKMEKTITTQTLQISALEAKGVSLSKRLAHMKGQEIAIVRLDERLKSMDKNLGEIKDLLRKSSP